MSDEKKGNARNAKMGRSFFMVIAVNVGCYLLWSNVLAPWLGLAHINDISCSVDVGVFIHDDVYFSYDDGGDEGRALTNVRVKMKLSAADGKEFAKECSWPRLDGYHKTKEEFNAVFYPWHPPDYVSLVGTCDQGKINILWENPRIQSGIYVYQRH